MRLGIQIGTTHISAAYMNAYDRFTMVENKCGESRMPVVIYFDETERPIIGRPALEWAEKYPQNVAKYVQRYLGNENYRFETFNNCYHAEDLIAIFLKEIKYHAECQTLAPLNEVVISIPNYFSELQREATIEAARLAGFAHVYLIYQATAAAVAHEVTKKAQNVLVLDIGQTFELAILTVASGVVYTKSIIYDRKLNGESFTKIIINHVAKKFRQMYGTNPKKDRHGYHDFWRSSEKCKVTLSELKKAPIRFTAYGQTIRDDLTRLQFENMSVQLLEQVKKYIEKALNEANIVVQEVDSVILTGGVTRMPQIRQLIENNFSGRVYQQLFPENTGIYGAALQAALMEKGQDIREMMHLEKEVFVEPESDLAKQCYHFFGFNPEVGMTEKPLEILRKSRRKYNNLLNAPNQKKREEAEKMIQLISEVEKVWQLI